MRKWILTIVSVVLLAVATVSFTPDQAQAAGFYDFEIKRGIALLDEHGPSGWIQKINLKLLNMGSVNNCVLGQVYGDFLSGAMSLPFGGERSWKFGFIPFEKYPFRYRLLTHEWKEALKKLIKKRSKK